MSVHVKRRLALRPHRARRANVISLLPRWLNPGRSPAPASDLPVAGERPELPPDHNHCRSIQEALNQAALLQRDESLYGLTVIDARTGKRVDPRRIGVGQFMGPPVTDEIIDELLHGMVNG